MKKLALLTPLILGIGCPKKGPSLEVTKSDMKLLTKKLTRCINEVGKETEDTKSFTTSSIYYGKTQASISPANDLEIHIENGIYIDRNSNGTLDIGPKNPIEIGPLTLHYGDLLKDTYQSCLTEQIDRLSQEELNKNCGKFEPIIATTIQEKTEAIQICTLYTGYQTGAILEVIEDTQNFHIVAVITQNNGLFVNDHTSEEHEFRHDFKKELTPEEFLDDNGDGILEHGNQDNYNGALDEIINECNIDYSRIHYNMCKEELINKKMRKIKSGSKTIKIF